MSNISLDIQIPPQKVFQVCFWGPNTFSPGVWKPGDMSQNWASFLKQGVNIKEKN